MFEVTDKAMEVVKRRLADLDTASSSLRIELIEAS